MSSWQDIKNDLAAHEGAAALLVTIFDAKGSTPRELGTKMLVYSDRVFGTIGGGRLEEIAIQRCREILSENTPFRGEMMSLPLGPELAQCCGGHVDLILSTPPAIEACHQVISIWNGREIAYSFQKSGTSAAIPIREENGETITLTEDFHPVRFTLALYGAGHVGRAIVNTIAPLPCQIHWIDTRAEEFPPSLPTSVQKHLVRDPKTVAREIPIGAHHLIMTHSHQMDLEIIAEILRQKGARFIGLIGSKTKWARFQKQLLQMGFSKDDISQITCPIGMSELEGKHPAEIAISVAADLLIRLQREARNYNNDNNLPEKSADFQRPFSQ